MTDIITAIHIADALERPRPTPEQQAVIQAPLTPALVVAGAGSGKTETMANRVLWLLANKHVTADQILGLTFTRKAAGELAERIRGRAAQLGVHAGFEHVYDAFEPVKVSTYNSFASSIYRENALHIGREGTSAVLGEASAWQLARSVVVASTHPELPALGKTVDTVTKAVLALSRSMSENLVDPAALSRFASDFTQLAELPLGGRGEYRTVLDAITLVGSLPVLIDLAEQYRSQKERHGYVEYSDQVALALTIMGAAPTVRAHLRTQYPVVLLDEYQDTSVVQTQLLSNLFAHTSVMAVGDPNQSIYGWRGASAANLDQFSSQFGCAPDSHYSLSTSWRNGHHILDIANHISAPLRHEAGISVDTLKPGPTATNEPVTCSYSETLYEEAETTAQWFAEHLRAASTPPSAAILFRARKTQKAFIEALRRNGVPFHVLGVAGLMSEPEIADLVSALHVIVNPAAGSELVRLLAGSAWRIGPKDLHTLSRLAGALSSRDYSHQPLTDTVTATLRNSLRDEESGSIIDALDLIGTIAPDHTLFGYRDTFSPEGLARLRDAARTFGRLRQRVGLDLISFVTHVMHELRIDIEVAANEHRTGGSANLDAFFDALTGYCDFTGNATLNGFLGWLAEAEWRDDLSPRSEDPEPGTVQLLTIHGAKGLEWELVAVPRMVEGELPGKPGGGTRGWLALGELPYPFRGDHDELPQLRFDSCDTRKELSDAIAEFGESVGTHHRNEERRLAYVAVTRAQHHLLLTGSYWATQTRPRSPSTFLCELSAAALIPELPEGTEYDTNPSEGEQNTFQWPLDPLGNRREAVTRAEHILRERLTRTDTDSPAANSPAHPWAADIALLLAERDATDSTRGDLPTRIPASQYGDYIAQPEQMAHLLQRPLPEKPYRATRLGTLFHEWVEHRYGVYGTAQELDGFPHEHDGDPIESSASAEAGEQTREDERALHTLIATFEQSPWAHRAPLEVEREVHLPLAGHIIICKIDAVFPLSDGRYQIVDWKTGKKPATDAELEHRQFQLALYRQAYADYRHTAPENIDAVFYYVSDNVVVEPSRLHTRDELAQLWVDTHGAA